jgi:hypothetical protein
VLDIVVDQLSGAMGPRLGQTLTALQIMSKCETTRSTDRVMPILMAQYCHRSFPSATADYGALDEASLRFTIKTADMCQAFAHTGYQSGTKKSDHGFLILNFCAFR